MNHHMNSKKTVSLSNAAETVKSGDAIWVSGSSEHTQAFLEALAERANELRDVTIATDHQKVGKKIGGMEYHHSFKVVSGIAEALTKTYENGDRVKFLKSTSKSVVEIICRDLGINTLVVEVGAPDEKGLCELANFGRTVTAAVNGYEGVQTRIAVVNEALEGPPDGAERVQVALSGFDMVCRDAAGDVPEASIA